MVWGTKIVAMSFQGRYHIFQFEIDISFFAFEISINFRHKKIIISIFILRYGISLYETIIKKTYALFHITFRYYFLYCQVDLGKWSRHVSQVFHINAILSQLESSRVLKDGENPIIATCFCLAATYIKNFPLAKLLNWVSSIFSKQ